MINTVEELQQNTSEYDQMIAEWRFLYHSYMGGPIYTGQGYLTRYLFESDEEYARRIENTPYDNQCKSIVHLYNSFIFANPPGRELGDWSDNPVFQEFLEDADLEGRSLDQFMRQVDITSSIFGHAWVIMDKSNQDADTEAEQIELGIRPYLSLYSPINVVAWDFARQANGSNQLVYLKVIESVNQGETVYREFTPEVITVYSYREGSDRFTVESTTVNELGRIPAVICYSSRTGVNGVGLSEITDISRINRTIYDLTSEQIAIIQLANHPSLVKTAGTQAGAGPGAIIQIEDTMDPGLKPFLLQPTSASLDGVRGSIKDMIDNINRMAAVGSVRATEAKTMSGVALEVENRVLNAKLSEKADNLELCEEQLMELWADWQDTEWTGVITYPDSFNARDKTNELAVLIGSNELATEDSLKVQIQRQLAELIVNDPHELSEILEDIDQENNDYSDLTVPDSELTHQPVTDSTLETHISDMLAEGYTLEEIKQLHPELLDVLLSGYVEMLNDRG